MKHTLVWPLLMASVLCAGTAMRAVWAAEQEKEPAVADAESKSKKSAGPKKKSYDYRKSKYKSDALAGSEPRTYKFNAKGEPVSPSSKGKSAGKKGKSDPPADVSGAAHAPESEHAAQEPAGPAAGKAGVKKAAPVLEEEYACSMGDYRGPNTADGRCPKCGMALQKAQ